MNLSSCYLNKVYSDLKSRLPWETEFHQTVSELFTSIQPVLEQDQRYREAKILERLIIPDLMVTFRVVWTDDANRIHTNYGYSVQFNNALGPYKGGTRFHPSVTQSSLKFLGFEQVFKNALTNFPLGAGMSGANIRAHSLSKNEMMRFCQSYMSTLFKYIGPNENEPTGGVGVGNREIGYLFGWNKKLTRKSGGTFTGTSREYGRTLLRSKATGFGVIYLANHALKYIGEQIEGKRIAVSGFGNVAWGVTKKAIQLGAKVITISGPDGFIFLPEGISEEGVEFIKNMRNSGIDEVWPFAEQFKAKYYPKGRPWAVPCDIAIPCAIQNELNGKDARNLINNRCQMVIEGANMPSTKEAVSAFLASGLVYIPGKAANAGGVAISGLDMAHHQLGSLLGSCEIDLKLQDIMKNIHEVCIETSSTYGQAGNYLMGANIGGFKRVAEAMIHLGAV